MSTYEERKSFLSTQRYSTLNYAFQRLWEAVEKDETMQARIVEAFPEVFEDRTCKWRGITETFPREGYYWNNEGRLCLIHGKDRRIYFPGTERWYALGDEQVEGWKFYGPLAPQEPPEAQ